MASIQINPAAYGALRMLSKTNAQMLETQERINSGLKVRSIHDDPVGYSIAQGMRSELKYRGAVEQSLSLGQSTLKIGAAAAESIHKLASSIKTKIVQARSDEAEHEMIQQDIKSLIKQIESQVKMAEFSGVNLLDGSSKPLKAVTGYTRENGYRAPQQVEFSKNDLRTGSNNITANDFAGQTSAATLSFGDRYFKGDLKELSFDLTDTSASPPEAVSLTVQIDPADTLEDVAASVQAAIQAKGGAFANVTVGAVGGEEGTELKFSDPDSKVSFDSASFEFNGGGLASLSSIDVRTKEGAIAAFSIIEFVLDKVQSVSTQIGGQQNQLENYASMNSKVDDVLKKSIGQLVDADMGEEAVKLSQVQVRQELGYQALSMINDQDRTALKLLFK